MSLQVMAQTENGTHCIAHHSTPTAKQISSLVPQKPTTQLICEDRYGS